MQGHYQSAGSEPRQSILLRTDDLGRQPDSNPGLLRNGWAGSVSSHRHHSTRWNRDVAAVLKETPCQSTGCARSRNRCRDRQIGDSPRSPTTRLLRPSTPPGRIDGARPPMTPFAVENPPSPGRRKRSTAPVLPGEVIRSAGVYCRPGSRMPVTYAGWRGIFSRRIL